ncbi:MAG: helix-turn-helix domain-containing protein, partial [Firmicutes bacterium]|nr:helix-turn-helix domain-containing protein [Bacillota bacterium]
MEIGSKLKNARLDTEMTQEQVAEAIGVTRQSVSNWENNRSYPDIISVIKMSDLYSISLDDLLKEGKDMSKNTKELSGYYDYLEESTNTVRAAWSSRKISELGAYLLVWGITILVFYTMSPGDEMGYVILSNWIVLPFVTIVVSGMIGHDKGWSKNKWFMIPAFGFMYALQSAVTFGIASQDIAGYLPDYIMYIVVGSVLSAIGLAAGHFMQRLTDKGFRRAMIIVTILLLIVPLTVIFGMAAYENVADSGT